MEAIREASIPPSSLLIAELCIDPLIMLDHMWAQKHMGEIQKADTLRGVCKPDQSNCLKRQRLNPVKAGVFGYLYHAGNKVWDLPYMNILKALERSIPELPDDKILFLPKEIPITSSNMAIELVKQNNLSMEGLVIWDAELAMEVTMNGKPLRRASWKIKAKEEMDVIAYDGEPGKVVDHYGSIKICRMDANGNQVDMGTVGGLKPKQGETDPSNWKFPCVIEVTYDNIFPDTGLLQFGSFSKIHEDKLPEEVNLFSLVSEGEL